MGRITKQNLIPDEISEKYSRKYLIGFLGFVGVCLVIAIAIPYIGMGITNGQITKIEMENAEYEYTEGGAVKTLFIDGKKFKGTDIRSVFDLRSANFEVKKNDNSVIFFVKGYGHGVGMSQYGANQCAKTGMTYEEILKKYYTDVDIK